MPLFDAKRAVWIVIRSRCADGVEASCRFHSEFEVGRCDVLLQLCDGAPTDDGCDDGRTFGNPAQRHLGGRRTKFLRDVTDGIQGFPVLVLRDEVVSFRPIPGEVEPADQ